MQCDKHMISIEIQSISAFTYRWSNSATCANSIRYITFNKLYIWAQINISKCDIDTHIFTELKNECNIFFLKPYLITQQTPNDAAQLPSPVPLEAHSVLVMQTPFSPAVEMASHSLQYVMRKNQYDFSTQEWQKHNGFNVKFNITLYFFLRIFERDNAEQGELFWKEKIQIIIWTITSLICYNFI